MADLVEIVDLNFGPGVRRPEPGEQVGWVELTPDNTVVNWGGLTELQAVSDLDQPAEEGS